MTGERYLIALVRCLTPGEELTYQNLYDRIADYTKTDVTGEKNWSAYQSNMATELTTLRHCGFIEGNKTKILRVPKSFARLKRLSDGEIGQLRFAFGQKKQPRVKPEHRDSSQNIKARYRIQYPALKNCLRKLDLLVDDKDSQETQITKSSESKGDFAILAEKEIKNRVSKGIVPAEEVPTPILFKWLCES